MQTSGGGRISLLGTALPPQQQQEWPSGTGTIAAAAPQTQQLGYGQAEHANMMSAIRQPLFIQTPLQVMLETLVEKLQLQATVISNVQDRLDALERNKVTGAELLSRIQLLEGRVDAATVAGVSAAEATGSTTNISTATAVRGTSTSSRTPSTQAQAAGSSRIGSAAGSGSPFAQAKIIQQVAALEQQTAGLQAALPQLSFKVDQVMLPRLQQCEQRLAGVHNLAGSLMAVDVMAAELGISVPHPPLSALTAGGGGGSSMGRRHDGGFSTSVSASGGRGSITSSSGAAAVSSSSGEAVTHTSTSGGVQQQQALPGGGVLTISRQQHLQQQIDTGRDQAAAMQQHLQQLQQQVNKLTADSASERDQQLSVLAGLQDRLSGLSDKLTQQGALLRREFKPALQAAEMQQLSMTEFTKLQRQVEAADTKHAALTKELAALKSKDFAELASSVAQLSRRVGRVTGTPGALSDTERALAAAQAELRGQVQRLSARLASHEAAELAGTSCMMQHDAEEQSGSLPGGSSSSVRPGGAAAANNPSSSSKTSSSEVNIRVVVNRAVELALQAHRDAEAAAAAAAGADGSAASRSRCLVCDRALRDGSPPRCSTAPQQQFPGAPELLIPFLDPFRPATAASTTAAAAGVGQAGGGASSGCTSGSSNSRQGTAGSSGGSSSGTGGVSGFGPMGPGLHAAQLRQMSAHRAGKLGGTSNGHRDEAAAAGAQGSSGSSAAAGGGILGLMPERHASGAEGPSAGVDVQPPGADGLFVAGLVTSNLRISSAAASGQQAEGLGGTALQQQQLTASRPQTAAVGLTRPQTATVAAVVRPGTAAASGAAGGVGGSSSPLALPAVR